MGNQPMCSERIAQPTKRISFISTGKKYSHYTVLLGVRANFNFTRSIL